MKDTDPTLAKSGEVYRISCRYGLAYIGKTKRNLWALKFRFNQGEVNSLYTALVCPHLEYVSCVWEPHQINAHQTTLHNVQSPKDQHGSIPAQLVFHELLKNVTIYLLLLLRLVNSHYSEPGSSVMQINYLLIFSYRFYLLLFPLVVWFFPFFLLPPYLLHYL